MKRKILGICLLSFCNMALAQYSNDYEIGEGKCAGLPQLKIQSAPGTCVGMLLDRKVLNAEHIIRENPVVQKSDRRKLRVKFPRTIVKIPGIEFYLLVDMGGWGTSSGSVFLIDRNADPKERVVGKILPNLKLPHGLKYSETDGYFYLGMVDKIVRFKLEVNGRDTKISSDGVQLVYEIEELDGNMHPLKELAIDPRNNDLYINFGAPSDSCDDDHYKGVCSLEEKHHSTIQKIPHTVLANLPSGGAKKTEVVAYGLRNSMAMVISEKGFLIQGENARDIRDDFEPYEELNVIDLNQTNASVKPHYGWPYYYNNWAVSSEWTKSFLVTDKASEFNYIPPHSLLPPHVAPLAAEYYQGPLTNGEKRLIMSWHGYRGSGQRMVSFKVDGDGVPIRELVTGAKTFNFNDGSHQGCINRIPFSPRTSSEKNIEPLYLSPYEELISGWRKIDNVRPLGRPVGFAQTGEGSLIIVEDLKSRKTRQPNVVILAPASEDSIVYRDKCERDGNIVTAAEKAEIVKQGYKKGHLDQSLLETVQPLVANCTMCHYPTSELGELEIESTDEVNVGHIIETFIGQTTWLDYGRPDLSTAMSRIDFEQSGSAPMPPTSSNYNQLNAEEIEQVRNWINEIASYRGFETKSFQITKSVWNVRKAPKFESKYRCFSLKLDDVVKLEVGDEVQGRWHRVIIPESLRPSKMSCPWNDGVFYIAAPKEASGGIDSLGNLIDR